MALAAAGWMTSLLRLPQGGAGVLVMTVACTAVLMISLLALELLAARGNLSALKAANTWGAVVAIPLCGAMVFFRFWGGSCRFCLCRFVDNPPI